MHVLQLPVELELDQIECNSSELYSRGKGTITYKSNQYKATYKNNDATAQIAHK